MSERKYKVCDKRIDSVSAYLQFVKDEKAFSETIVEDADFIFRGQPGDWPLIPKLQRIKWHGDVFALEQLILEEFDRTTVRYSRFSQASNWELISIAQHHGLPTRFLDWTYSALAALWFVVRDGPKENEDHQIMDGVVWILKTTGKDFINFGLTPTSRSEVGEPFLKGRSRIYRPKMIADRIQAQSGLFTVHAEIGDEKRFIPLETNSNFSEKLAKIPILAKDIDGLRKQLHVCGVNYSTMFPDLDGTCKHLTWRFTECD